MIQIAKLFASLRAGATSQRLLSVQGRSVAIYSHRSEVATAACRSLSAWTLSELESATGTDDVCLVETYSKAGVQPNNWNIPPARQHHHPGMGTFLGYELADGSAVVQAGRGALLCSAKGELVWLVDDALLTGESDRWPNFTDLAIVFLAEILRRGGFFLAHAGGIGREGRSLLLTGESGSGKSTLAVRKAMEGWDFYGDDMVIVGKDPEGIWRVYPFRRPIHLTANAAQLLGVPPGLTSELTHSNKLQYDISELCQARQSHSGTLAAVFCLRPDWTVKEPEPLSQLDALSVLGLNFLSGWNKGNVASELENLLGLLVTTPVYQASWATDPSAFDNFLNPISV
jgi:hypothetical protein